MSAIATSPIPSQPQEIIDNAIRWALEHGFTVVPSAEAGVVCLSVTAEERWFKAVRAAGPNPLGAVILEYQPAAPDVEKAAAAVLGVSVPWVLGFEVGVSGQLPLASWQGHIAERLIGQGYASGVETRTKMWLARRR